MAREPQEMDRRPRPRVAVIDFDDTLAASKTPFLHAAHEVLQIHLDQAIDMSRVAAATGTAFPEFFANFRITDATEIARVIERFVAAWPRHAAQCQVPVGTHSLLSCLQREGVRIHVWTVLRETWIPPEGMSRPAR